MSKEVPSSGLEEEKFRCLRHRGCIWHDVFISYRVNTDKKIADKLALMLDTYTRSDGQKIRTFLDSNCLLDGGNWEMNFMSALSHAKLIVLLISEAGLDLPSFSAPGKTKIQNAMNEQDNCLLEYEETLKLKEQGKAEVLVLCVAQDGKLDGRSCKIKFPTAPERIAERLQIYDASGPHKYRNGKYGPEVRDTMSKLLGLLISPEQDMAPNYAHLDPDDVTSRLPDIIWKLHEVDLKIPRTKKIKRFLKDIVYAKVKIFGTMLGTTLPIISLLFVLGARSPRQKALQYGILLGHSIDLFGMALWLLILSYTIVPSDCTTFDKCLNNNAQSLADNHADILSGCGCETGNWTSGCESCFCNGWWYYCVAKETESDMSLFLGIMFVAMWVAAVSYAQYILSKVTVKKYRMKGV